MEETYPLTLELSDEVYAELERRAAAANRTVEEEIIAILTIAFPPEPEESEALNETLESLPLLGNEALWSAAQSKLPEKLMTQIESLEASDTLSEEEAKTLEELKQEYERVRVIRAQAIVLLKERGYDISEMP